VSTKPVADGSSSIRRTIAATWACLTPTTRRKLVISAILAAVLAGIDAIGIGLLPSLVRRFQATNSGFLAGLSTPVFGAVIAALLILKSTGGALLLYWQSAFIAHDESERTIALFRHLFRLPYGETSGTNTSEFVRDLHVSLPLLYRGAAAGLGQLIADALGLTGLVAVVFLSSPLTGLVLFTFLVVAAWLYSVLIRSRVSRLSVNLRDQNRDVLNDLNESFGGLKTLKAFAAEGVVIGRFTDTRRRFAITARDLQFYQQISRYYLEIALVIGLGACLGTTYVVQGRGAVLAAFGLLSGVAARAMPALGRCLYSLTFIKVSGAAVTALEPDLRQIEETEEPVSLAQADGGAQVHPSSMTRPSVSVADPNQAPLVTLDRIRFRYPTAGNEALQDVSLELRQGELVSILGESGAGKTTLVDVLVGLLSPDRGTVVRPSAASVGYVAQETFVWDETVRFNVALGRPSAAGDDEAEIWASLEAARLAQWVRSLPEGLDAPMGERGGRISGGQRQRLGLARALYGHPSILVLDEPTSALDGETSRSLMSTLAAVKTDIGIIVVTHDPIVMEYSDRTITLGATAGRVST
jgi:ABC-type multidrug transport system fused ATPase/permease subunit